MIPGLRLLLGVSLIIRQRRAKEAETGGGRSKDLAGQAEGHEVDEGALAAAGVAQEHEMWVAVELLQGGERAFPFPGGSGLEAVPPGRRTPAR